MKHLFCWLLLAICFTTVAFAQDKTVSNLKADASRKADKPQTDTIAKAWRKGGVVGINISQGSLSNWSAGGDEFSLSLNNLVSLYALYKKDNWSWDNTFDLNYGLVHTTSLGTRKNDDRLDLFSKLGHAIAPKWNIAALANFRSQLFKGYIYDNNVKSLSSDFLSPAYLLFGLGLDFKPNNDLSLYISPLTARLTIVKNDSLAAKGAYGVDSGKHIKYEVGAFLSAGYIKSFSKQLSYKGRLDLFSNYRHKPGNIDMYFTNIFSANLSKALAVSWNLDLIYDDDVKIFGSSKNSAALQIKSLVGIGLLWKLGVK